MNNILTLRRAFVINRVLIRHGLDEFLAPTPISRMTGLLKLFALSRNQNKQLNRGQRLNQALTELGPIFVKLGQMLSTRRDLLPPDIADELAKLQDKVVPFDSDVAKKIVEESLEQPIETIFSYFSESCLASASVAQVHSATLVSGEEVVVKIIRPGIEKQINADLKLLKLLAGWFEKYSKVGKRLHATTIIEDYKNSIANELDLRVEAANTSQLKRNFENSSIFYVPKIYWDYSRESVMVQERIKGIPIGDIEALKEADVDLSLLAKRGVEIFFTQVFKDSYFHADMHPGNIFVNAKDPKNPKYIGIDCGIMGTLSENDKKYLAKNFMAFFDRDYRRIAELHVESGWISNRFSVEEFESAIRTACEPIFGKPLDEISFGSFLVQLFQTASRFEMEVQPQLVLLQKTLLYVEGLGRQLYPKLDLWETAQPFLNNWLKDTYGPQAIWKKVKSKAPEWLQDLPDIPDKINLLLTQLKSKDEQQKKLIDSIAELKLNQKRNTEKLIWTFLGMTLLGATFINSPGWMSLDFVKSSLIGLSLVSFVISFRR